MAQSQRRRLDEDFVTKTGLIRDRGWTEAGVREFAGDPDKVTVNMYYKSGPGVQWFDIKRIEAIERTVAFQEWAEKAKRRKASANKGADTKAERTRQFLDAIKIKVPILTDGELLDRAIDHYNDLHSETEKWANKSDDAEFLARLKVNYLRHELSEYEELLGKLKGRVGAAEGYFDVREKVLHAIAYAYPDLRAECFRQRQAKRL